MSPDFTDLDSSLSKAIQIMPVQLAQPIFNIYRSPIYFKRLHLISDFILGFLRLYGHAILQLAETRELADESLSQTIDTLRTKDTHGLWSTTISALLQKFDDAGDLNVPGGLFPIFGLSAKKRKTGKVSR